MFNETKPLSDEVSRVKELTAGSDRDRALKRLAALVDVLKMSRDEVLPRMVKIETKINGLEPMASRKSKAAFALIRRAVADSRRVYNEVVPTKDVLDAALQEVQAMQSSASAGG